MVNQHKAGVAYLKVVLQQTSPNNRSNVNYIRTQLTGLHTHMKAVNSDIDIEKFNQHVDELRTQLSNEGAETHDLLINLFLGWKLCRFRQTLCAAPNTSRDCERTSMMGQNHSHQKS